MQTLQGNFEWQRTLRELRSCVVYGSLDRFEQVFKHLLPRQYQSRTEITNVHARWMGCWGCGPLLDSDRSEPKGRYGVNLMTIMSMDDFESMMQSGHQMNTIGCSKEDGVWQSR